MVTKNKHRIREKLSAIFFIAVFLVAILGSAPKAGATGTLTSMWLFETNMDATQGSMVYIAFKAATTAAPGTTTVTFGTGTTTAAIPTVSSTGCGGASGIFGWLNGGAGATALPGTLTGAGSGATITISGATTSITSGTIYCFGFTSAGAVTNPAANLYSYTLTDVSDSGTNTYAVLSSGANMSIGVTTAVTQYFTLTVAGGTQSLGSLTTASIANSSADTATVSSNAIGGVSLFAYDQYTGLYSSAKTTTINSVVPNSGSIQTVNSNPTAASFVTTVNANGYSQGVALTIPAPFNGSVGSATTTGDGLSPTPAVIGYTSVPTYLAVAKIYDSAAINSATPIAADYTDTVYVVGSGAY